MEKKLLRILPDKIALAFDGWSSGSDHYIVVFATFDSQNTKGCDAIFLAFSTLKHAESQSAQNHIEFLNFVLDFSARQ